MSLCSGSAGESFPLSVPVPYRIPGSLQREHIRDESPGAMYSTAQSRPQRALPFCLNVLKLSGQSTKACSHFQGNSLSQSQKGLGKLLDSWHLPDHVSSSSCPDKHLYSNFSHQLTDFWKHWHLKDSYVLNLLGSFLRNTFISPL